MKTTMRGVLLNVDDDTSQLLDRLMRKYGYMYRYAFQRLQEAGMKIGVLERILSTETNLPLRYAKDAVAEANQLIFAQKALVKEHLALWQRRKKKTTERINKMTKKDPNSRKLNVGKWKSHWTLSKVPANGYAMTSCGYHFMSPAKYRG